jgi:tetratricopeptide (TPR) repeat protein
MKDDNWFRSPAWDDVVKQEFRAKLSRSRLHKYTYLRTKAAAIADRHMSDALALLDEYIAADVEHVPTGNYCKSIIHLKCGHIDIALAFLDTAIGKTGMDMQSPALLEYVFLVGLHQRSALYQRALGLLDALDELAQKESGRPFNRNFSGNAGAAFILHSLGQFDDAKYQAKAALELALAKAGPIPNHPQFGRVPKLPKELMNRLLTIADISDDDFLGK